jgi:hypothetical protein
LPFGDTRWYDLMVVIQQRDSGVRKQLALAIVLMSAAGAASAGTNPLCVVLPFLCPAPLKPEPVKAPEIDPSSAIAAMTLLTGGLAVLRGRRIKATEE